MSAPLSSSELDLARNELPDWTYEDDRLSREVVFRSFKQAMAFIQRLAFEAEEQNHYPEIYNVGERIVLALTSSEAEYKVTKRDVLLAHKIDKLLGEFEL